MLLVLGLWGCSCGCGCFWWRRQWSGCAGHNGLLPQLLDLVLVLLLELVEVPEALFARLVLELLLVLGEDAFLGVVCDEKAHVLNAGKAALSNAGVDEGLAQSMARELAPKGIHVAHFVIDGGIRSARRPERQDAADSPDSTLDPDAIARTYLHVLEQDRSAWSWEVELRPWVERF